MTADKDNILPDGLTLECDYCGVGMDYHPWHGSDEKNRHIHACNDCRHNLPSLTKHEADQRVIDAVAGARKAWAAQGCPEVKALHGAEAIRKAVELLSKPLGMGIYDACPTEKLLAYANELEQRANGE